MRCALATALACLFPTVVATTATAAAGEVAAVCFTPGENCTGLIVGQIDAATHDILVQAYSFTARPIGNALAEASRRGVNVRVIVDNSELDRGDNEAPWLARQGVPILVDAPPAGIAHNKVIVIDGHLVITGSFNFTFAAQYRNAENLVVIDSADIAGRYVANWQRRAKDSTRLR